MMKKTKDLEEMKFSMMLVDTSPSLTIAKSKEPLCSHRVIRKVTLSSPVFGPPFTPLSHLSMVSAK
jgi:hypothetical protein